MRRAICTAAIIVGLLGGAFAQNNKNSGTNMGMTKHEAPIGHRQPTLKSLPPDVLQNEPKSAPGEREYDKTLTICRGCYQSI
jgi:hemolysin-activating ACP:hemolysin acyltransferase